MTLFNSQKSYDLERFLDPYDFPTDPEDKIEFVKLHTVKLRAMNNQGCVTLTLNKKEQNSFRDVAGNWFDDANPFSTGFLVYQIRLLVKFYSQRMMPLTISHPCDCNLRCFDKFEREILIKYLKRWNLIEEY